LTVVATIVALAIIGEECLFEISYSLVCGRRGSGSIREYDHAWGLWAAFNVLILILVLVLTAGTALLAYRAIRGRGALRALFMRILPMRFTVRRLMVAVGVAAWLSAFLPELIGAILSAHDAYYEWRVLSALSKLVVASVGLALFCFAIWAAVEGPVNRKRHPGGAISVAPDPPGPE
jgi:hypothetical protein